MFEMLNSMEPRTSPLFVVVGVGFSDLDYVGFGFQVVVVEWLGLAFTKEGSTWTKVVFEVLGSQEKEEDQGKTRRGEERKGKKRKRGVSNFFKIKCKNKQINLGGMSCD